MILSFAAIGAFLWRNKFYVLAAVGLLIVFGIVYSNCSGGQGGVSKKAQENITNADAIHDKGQVKEGERIVREEIRANANENVNQAGGNVNAVRNGNYRNSNSADADRKLRELYPE